MSKPQRIVNIAELALQDGGNGKGFQAKLGRAGPMLGLKRLGCSLTVVPPGKRAWPFHRHHVTDELFYIVSGNGEVRLDDQTLAVRAGDLIASPAGLKPTRSSTPARASCAISIIEFPDSEKVAMAAGVKDGNLSSASYKAMGRVMPADYFDGEDTNDKK